MSDIDVIFVSPLYRALQTCHIVYGDIAKKYKIPVIVDPIFS